MGNGDSGGRGGHDRIIHELGETEKSIKNSTLTLLGLGAFTLLAIAQPDAYLLSPAATITVPSVGATTAKAALIAGPLLLIGVRIYLQVCVDHWYALDKDATQKNIEQSKVISPMRQPLIRGLVWAVLYLLVPVALVVFTWKAMVMPTSWGIALMVVTIFVSFVHLMLFLSAVKPLQKISGGWRSRLAVGAAAAALGGGIIDGYYLEDLRRSFDLRYADLHNTDLENADLRDADMRQVNLEGADLRGAILRRADLFKANLTGADLEKAELQNTNLREVDFYGADLQDANLAYARLIEANLHLADLKSVHLEGANLEGANLEGASLKRAFLDRANFSKACLRSVNFRFADFGSADLSQANVQGSNFRKANLENAKFSSACGDGGTILPDGYTVPKCTDLLPSCAAATTTDKK